MKRILGLFLFIFLITGCGQSSSLSPDRPSPILVPEKGEELSGGSTTVFDKTFDAFSSPIVNLALERRNDFFVGDSFFNQNWVSAPSTNTSRDGLGPVFNAHSCAGCHAQDGRANPFDKDGQPDIPLLFRLSVKDQMTDKGAPFPDLNYGDQLNPLSNLGIPNEGKVEVVYKENPEKFADGEIYSLREPTYNFINLQFGEINRETTLVSPRVAPQMIGLGLLEAIPEEAILTNADLNDSNGDGISGRPNYVWEFNVDKEKEKKSLGRFGWKANQPTVPQQVVSAFLGDLGVTSSLFPNQNCTAVQTECQAAPDGGRPELIDSTFEKVTFYSRTLAVPARRDWDNQEVLAGKKLFVEAKCALCHIPQFTTGEMPGFPELSHQTIRPFTDLLLHDMGPGLADNRPDFEATGSEWRTPPLWGIGLVKTVNQHTNFLHDGRARDLKEAILWHGGEAEQSRESFRKMSAQERANLIRFLESL